MALSRARSVLIPIAFWVVLLLGVEVAARIFLEPITSRQFHLELFGDPPDRIPPEHKPTFAGDASTFWRVRPNLDEAYWDFTMFSTNEDGFRDPVPITGKPEGTFRILALGDSVTFGYRVPLVFPENLDQWDRNGAPYPRRIERALRARQSDIPVEVVTAGIPGFSSHQGRILFEEVVDRVEPDVVLVNFGYNDTTPRNVEDKSLMPLGGPDVWFRGLAVRSQAFLHLLRWWRGGSSAPPASGPRVPRVSVDDYVANIEAIARGATERGARTVVIAPIFRDPETVPEHSARIAQYRQRLADSLAGGETAYLVIPELTEAGHPQNQRLFGEMIHPSAIGLELMATSVLELLDERGWAPGAPSEDGN